jgi:hypothetical protein
MSATLYIALVLGATVMTAVLAARHRRGRRAARDPMAQAFRGREFRQFDAHLETVACEERQRLEGELADYLAGRAGHVVVVSKARHGVALELSDGRRLALRGISARTVELIDYRAPRDMLRPADLNRDIFSYHLLLRGAAGADINVHARNITLAA